ncbi:hypothetical protein D1871_00450 [Nakamurella silvestris]|nr:hypothetical protein D1871_00450 [Nakamurella silvestris]
MLLLSVLLPMVVLVPPAGADRPTAVAAVPPPAVAEFPPETPNNDLPVPFAWGVGDHGQIGDGTQQQRPAPVMSIGGGKLAGKEISDISVGNGHTCAAAEGAAYCWGWNSYGELGTEDAVPSSSAPIRVGGLLTGRTVTEVSAGDSNTCAVADGAAYCWGSNDFGQLGDGSQKDSPVPVAVSTEGPLGSRWVTAISVYGTHVCAVASGRAYCWGRNESGQLGSLVAEKSVLPVAVDTSGVLAGKSVQAITTGAAHTCVVAEGAAYCWGRNIEGQLGTGNYQQAALPHAVYTIGALHGLTVKSIDAGRDNTCVVAGTGTTRRAYCWGFGEDGALGDNNVNTVNQPVSVTSLGKLGTKDVDSVTIDEKGGCVIATGLGYCWGDPDLTGRLGMGQLGSSMIPVPVFSAALLSGRTMTSIDTGAQTSAAIAVTTPSFGDVGLKQPFVDDITWLAGTGTAAGYADGTFHPTSAIDRQAMMAFLFRFANPGQPDPECTGDTRVFDDVGADNVFCGVIEWAADRSITLITPNKLFAPAAAVTRGVMATWIRRTEHPGLPDAVCGAGPRLFADVTAATPFCGNIEWLGRTGITTGYPNKTFRTAHGVRRDSMAAFFHRWGTIN